MIIIRSRRQQRLRIAAIASCFALGFVTGCWRRLDHGDAAKAIAEVNRIDHIAAKIEARISSLSK